MEKFLNQKSRDQDYVTKAVTKLAHPWISWSLKFQEIGYHNSESESEVAQSCPTLCDPMDCSLPGFSVHGIFQQEYWSGLPFPSPGDLPDPGIKLASLALAGRFFTAEPPGKPQKGYIPPQGHTAHRGQSWGSPNCSLWEVV